MKSIGINYTASLVRVLRTFCNVMVLFLLLHWFFGLDLAPSLFHIFTSAFLLEVVFLILRKERK